MLQEQLQFCKVEVFYMELPKSSMIHPLVLESFRWSIEVDVSAAEIEWLVQHHNETWI